ETGEIEKLRDPAGEHLAADAEIPSIDLEIFGDGEIGIEIVDLRDDADADARRTCRLRHRQVENLDRAAIGIDETEAAAECGRLPGAVGSEQAEAFAAADLERQSADDFVIPVALAKIRDAQDDVGTVTPIRVCTHAPTTRA